jgi:hypothetical protein
VRHRSPPRGVVFGADAGGRGSETEQFSSTSSMFPGLSSVTRRDGRGLSNRVGWRCHLGSMVGLSRSMR